MFDYSIYNQAVFRVTSGSSCYYFCPGLGNCFYMCYETYDKPDKFYYQKINFKEFISSEGYAPPRDSVCVYCHGCNSAGASANTDDILKISYSIKTGELKIILNDSGYTPTTRNCVKEYKGFNNCKIFFSRDGEN